MAGKSARSAVSAFVSFVVVTGVLVVVPLAQPAAAWKPPTHLFGVESALQDALDDGQVTIPSLSGGSVTAPVDPTILSALQAHPEAYRAGAIGPDAFPDLLFGQGQIHPDTCTHNDDIQPNPSPCPADTARTFEWLRYLWEQAWDPSPPAGENRLENIAFALGYMGGHANGDVWAHTWINGYAQGVFPDFTDLLHSDISVRHVIVEGYADKHRPGADDSPPSSFAIDAPTDFIGRTLILSNFSRSHSSYPLFDFFFGMRDSLAAQEADVEFDNQHQDTFEVCDPITGSCVDLPDPTDSPLNLVELGIDLIIESYLEHWIDDIDDGLKAWPEVWETIAAQAFSGQGPTPGVITDALKDWVINHFLSMMGLPDIIGQTISLVSEVVDFILGLVNTALDALFDAITSLPVIGPVFQLAADLYDKTKSFILSKVNDLVDELAGLVITAALGFTNLNPATRDAIDKDNDGVIKPSEVLRVFQEPQEYIEDPALFAAGTRALVDADMHFASGCTDDDASKVFCDYDPELFGPLKDTTTLAKLAMLDQGTLSSYVRQQAGGSSGALSDLYGVHTNSSGGWTVPNNVMLGWVKSIDAEYQWRTNSFHDGHSYGTGGMRLYEDCVSRIRVFRQIFRQPVAGVDAFADVGPAPFPAPDPPTGLSDAAPPVSSLALSGPNFSSGGITYVSGITQLLITSNDNYWTKPDLRVLIRTFPAASPAPAYPAGVAADPAPFSLTGLDEPKVVQFKGIDGQGTCNVEAEQTRNLTLDNTGPTITISSPPAGSVFDTDDLSSIAYTAVDSGSGVASDSVTLDGMPATNGQVLDMFFLPPGTRTIVVTATDNLGNIGTATRTFEIHATAASLSSNLDRAFALGLITDPAVYRGLKDKIQAAVRAHNRGQHAVEQNVLAAFINELLAQRGQGIDAATADRLIAYAQDLIARNG